MTPQRTGCTKNRKVGTVNERWKDTLPYNTDGDRMEPPVNDCGNMLFRSAMGPLPALCETANARRVPVVFGVRGGIAFPATGVVVVFSEARVYGGRAGAVAVPGSPSLPA